MIVDQGFSCCTTLGYINDVSFLPIERQPNAFILSRGFFFQSECLHLLKLLKDYAECLVVTQTCLRPFVLVRKYIF